MYIYKFSRKTIKKSIILISILIISILNLSCDSFINGALLKENLDELIEYNKAEAFDLNFTCEPETGSLDLATKSVKVTDQINLNFSVSSKYQFLRWVCIDNDTKEELTDYVDFEDANNSITKAKILKIGNYTIKPLCAYIPTLKSFVPENNINGVERNSTITVTFDHELYKDDEVLSQIQITSDGEDLKEYFENPVLNGAVLQILPKEDVLIPIESNTREISVFIPSSFYYFADNETKIFLNKEYTKKYKINNITNEKTTLNITCTNGAGELNISNDVSYSIGTSVDITFTPKSTSYFVGWNVTNGEGVIELSSLTETTINVKILRNSTTTIYLKAITYERPEIITAEFQPENKGSGVPKNSSILIPFSKQIEEDCLKDIQIKIGESDIKEYFQAPVLSENKVIFQALDSKFINISSGTKTVTVYIPSSLYYIVDETQVNIGVSHTFTYIINSNTITQSEVYFSQTDSEAGTVFPSGTKFLNLGETINLQFTPKDNYRFIQWKVTDGDNIVNVENKTSQNTKITAIKASSLPVKVEAVTSVFPQVSSFTPLYSSNGVSMDSTITITFNKEMSSDIVDYNYLHIINTYGNDLKSYFIEPTFNGNGLSLKLKKDLLDEFFGSNDYVDVRFTLEVEAKDGDGYTINQFYPDLTILNLGKTRFNKDRVESTPEWNSENPISLYRNNELKAQNEQLSSIYISDSSFDYSVNHVKNSVLISVNGHDVGSGIKTANITESLITLKNGTPGAESYDAFACGAFTWKTGDIYSAEFEYNLRSTQDGIIKLDIELENYTNNKTDKKTFYVIKDTYINPSAFVFSGTNTITDFASQGKLTISAKKKDTDNSNVYYTGVSENLSDYKVFASYKKTDGTYTDREKLSLSGNTFSKIVDFSQNDFENAAVLKINLIDEVGNEAELNYVIPKKIKYSYFNSANNIFIAESIGDEYKTQYKSLAYCDYYQEQNGKYYSSETLTNYAQLEFNHVNQYLNNTFTGPVGLYIQSGYNSGEDEESVFYCPYLGEAFIYNPDTTTYEIGNASEIDIEVPDFTVSAAKDEINSDSIKITAELSNKNEYASYVLNVNDIYVPFASNSNSLTISCGLSANIDTTSGNKICVKVIASNSVQGIEKSDTKEVSVTAEYDTVGPVYTNASTETPLNFRTTYDGQYLALPAFKDLPETVNCGLKIENEKLSVEWYLVPYNSSFDGKTIKQLSEELSQNCSSYEHYKENLEKLTSNEIALNSDDEEIYGLPVYGMKDEQKYVVIVKVYDANGNYSYIAMLTGMVAYLPDIEMWYLKNSSYRQNRMNYSQRDGYKNYVYTYYYWDVNDSKWKLLNTRSCEQIYTTDNPSYFHKVCVRAESEDGTVVAHAVPDYYTSGPTASRGVDSFCLLPGSTCTLFESLTGFTLLTDCQTIIYTVSAKENYGQDISSWEKFGKISNVIVYDLVDSSAKGNYQATPEPASVTRNYTVDLSEVESGDYYCVIVHSGGGKESASGNNKYEHTIDLISSIKVNK